MMVRPNPNARLWLFDFDNTLAALEREVDWPGSRRELESYLRDQGVAREIFVEIPKGNLPLYAALHSRWLRASSGEANLVRLPRERAATLLRRSSEIIERHELAGVERAEPTPGAIELLGTIASSGPISMIVTSNSSRTVARWLHIHGISDLVSAVVGRDSLLALKPSPEMIAHALELAATAPAREGAPAQAVISLADTVFVGDSEADLGAARAAGLGLYGIARTEAAQNRLRAAGATELFNSPAELREHLSAGNLEPPTSAKSS